MTEPPRISDIDKLRPDVAEKVKLLIQRMRVRGFDPVVFETLRTKERQQWLYGIGRTHSLDRKPVTWTLKSKHLEGKAADIISKSRGWNWPAFYAALGQEARAVGLRRISKELCHVEVA